MKPSGRVVSLAVTVVFLALQLSAGEVVSEINSPAGTGSAEPFLSPTTTGVLLSWLEPAQNNGNTALRFSEFGTSKWSPVRTIAQRNDFVVNWADFPSIVEDGGGVLYAHWIEKNGSDPWACNVRLSVSSNRGTSWSQPLLLNRDGTRTEHGFVSLLSLATGVGITWLDGRNMVEGKEEEGEMSLRYAALSPGGALTGDVQLDSRTCECCTTSMALASGGPIIAYRDRSSEEVRDIATVRRTATGWSKPTPIHDDGWKIKGCPVNGPQIDAAGQTVVAAWFVGVGDHGKVRVAFSADGGATFAAPLAVDLGKPIGRVDVILLDADSALVTWVEQTGGSTDILARRISRHGPLGTAVRVGRSSNARAVGFPRMARHGRDVYFAWTDQTATEKRVRVARGKF